MKIFAKHILFSIIILLLLFGCDNSKNTSENNTPQLTRLDKIKQRGKLVAITGYNAYSYFLYRGQPMGFEYELLKHLTADLGVELEIKIVKDVSKMFQMVKNGNGDLIAFNLTVTKPRKKDVNFTSKINTITQVLIQRKPDNWRDMTLDGIDKTLIRDVFDLENKTIVVRSNSAYKERLINLSNEIGADINIELADPEETTEELIEKVANGEIDYTISDDNIAKLNHAYYSNIDIKTKIALPQKIAWAVNKKSDSLLTYVNDWLVKLQKKVDFYVIYNRYYKNRYSYRKRRQSDYLASETGNISKYDSLLKTYADTLGWDWRVLASQIYQESQFDPKATSWAGAKGLMQIMPITAKQYNLKNVFDPYKNLDAGLRHIMWLNNYWAKEIADSTTRLKFVLASYNIGLTHIKDARRLAEKYGADPNDWENSVSEYLLKKSKPKFYTDEVVQAGYCRGVEAVKYVKEILERYNRYKQFVS